jgi:hypothetical protein
METGVEASYDGLADILAAMLEGAEPTDSA